MIIRLIQSSCFTAGAFAMGSLHFKRLALGCFLWLLGGSLTVQAQRPFEVLLLINSGSATSVRVAHAFAEGRGIPPRNMVYLDLPDTVLGVHSTMTPSEFTQYIWEPAQQHIQHFSLERLVTAWVYSTGFPTKIAPAVTPVSLQGITFCRNQLPDQAVIAQGTYLSELFAGPDQPQGGQRPSGALRILADGLGPRMPLPSMMLGFNGTRGNTLEEIQAVLKRGVAADMSHPSAPVLFQQHGGVRSRARQWQFKGSQAALEQLGLPVKVVGGLTKMRQPALGLLAGTEHLEIQLLPDFVPGAMADHLTSFAGFFSLHAQSKLSVWLAAGATASAGTVHEPMALWTKFPHARFFEHYAQGCTMLESFFQSIRSPLQILLVGEPLCRPFAKKMSAELDLRNAAEGHVFEVITSADETLKPFHYTWLVDGQVVLGPDQSAPQLTLQEGDLSQGRHTVEVYVTGHSPTRPYACARHLVERTTDGLRVLDRNPSPKACLELLGFRGAVPNGPVNHYPLESTENGRLAKQSLRGAKVKWTRGWAAFHTEALFEVLPVESASERSYQGVSVDVVMEGEPAMVQEGDSAMIAFDVQDENNFKAFGLIGPTGGWGFIEYKDKQLKFLEAIGQPVRSGVSYRLAVQRLPDEIRGFVNGQEVCRHRSITPPSPLRWGVVGGRANRVRFSDLQMAAAKQ